MYRKTLFSLALLAAIAVALILVTTYPAEAGKLEDAIAKTPQGAGTGMIDPQAAKGFMGITGAPSPFLLYSIDRKSVV